MKTLKNLWISIKRNPVINAFIAAAIVQFLQDYVAGTIDWPHFSGYLATLLLGVGARMFTVPAKEHDSTIENLNTEIHLLRKGEIR